MAHRTRKGRRSGHTAVSVGIIHIARKGYGFVDTPEGEYFVLRGYIRGAMDGDLVEVVRLRRLEDRRRQQIRRAGTQHLHPGAGDGGREMLGGVRRVLERAHQTVVGTLHLNDGLGVVTPVDEHLPYHVFLDRRAVGAPAQEGDVVVVRLTTYPSKIEAAQGYIEEVVGHADQKGMDIEVIIRKHGLETLFSAAALEEAEVLAEAAPAHKEAERRDLRERLIFTIDPTDARDFDDALSVDFIEGQLRLGVHIADVSAFVQWGSALDLEARRRATSVYLPDRVIPMLPSQISDNLCSLRPNEDRLAFTVDMIMRSDGSVQSAELYPSLIHSAARLTYDEAQDILDAGHVPTSLQRETRLEPERLLELSLRLLALNKLSKKLTRRRLARGAIEFEGVEAKVSLDEQGVPTGVRLRSKTEATSLVEEAMILANETVAAHMLKRGAPMVFRIHDEPFQAALDELLPTLQEFGYAAQRAPQTSPEIQRILDASAGKPEHALISTLLLRAMKRAKYAPVYTTHFGLASSAYTHFTSPIRRYPDLMVHRLLKYQLAAEEVPASISSQLAWICEHSSNNEREAEHTENDAIALKLAEFLAPRVGERFEGIVTGLNSYGFYVRENSTTAEGFVERSSFEQPLDYDQAHQRYIDADTGTAYRLGQLVKLVLKDVDLSKSSIQFVIG
ncbi:MAG: ribonuclease R [Coriobacteriales bacterium]|jgi:ribonuclease R|nr:ribonuclease R [Coriobacteriales bacterium]